MPDGKICYIEIPTTDVDASARFYAEVFRWSLRKRGDGRPHVAAGVRLDHVQILCILSCRHWSRSCKGQQQA